MVAAAEAEEMSNFLDKVNRLLTPQRISYAWLMAGALWIAWLISIALGPGYLDLNRHVVGTDYIQFYAAGQTLRSGQEARLFDFEYQQALEREIAQEEFRGIPCIHQSAFSCLVVRAIFHAGISLELCAVEPAGVGRIMVQSASVGNGAAQAKISLDADLFPNLCQHQFWSEQPAQPAPIQPGVSLVAARAPLLGRIGCQPAVI